MKVEDHTEDFVELIRLCATELPSDVKQALKDARDKEEEGGMAYNTFASILENVEVAKDKKFPMCQDTGAPILWINYNPDYPQMELETQITEAVRRASKIPYLRPNAVDSLSGKNSGDNTGAGVPIFHFHQWDKDYLEVNMMLKGGGSENASSQYKLPNGDLGAGRNLEGVRKCVIDAINNVQGLGCAPGVIGVGIGGNRDTGFEAGKKRLLTKFDEPNPNPELDKLEKQLLEDINQLGIGPMGFGGRTTVLNVKVAALHRLPACYFVSVAYTCWAMRRHTMTVKEGVVSYD
jgi:fumarate hydratase class I